MCKNRIIQQSYFGNIVLAIGITRGDRTGTAIGETPVYSSIPGRLLFRLYQWKISCINTTNNEFKDDYKIENQLNLNYAFYANGYILQTLGTDNAETTIDIKDLIAWKITKVNQ